ncbi:MAG: hypothetical protein QOE90_799 [Thermoplasmata archaeon]|jgi:predicted RNase H-like nuclease|nr:hypothetical protein [Thermoplasmata archaeon]
MTGIDGCPGGWIAVSKGRCVVGDLATVLRGAPRPVLIDMPIGLAEGDRPCDKAARKLLGPRRASVFAPPARRALDATAWSPALGISKQCYHLLPRIREVDAWITPARQRRVREAHPELAFARMGGGPMRHAKRTPEGLRERDRALRLADAPIPERPSGTRRDDLLDACALAWSADRLARGEALVLGGERDARGLRMEIVA